MAIIGEASATAPNGSKLTIAIYDQDKLHMLLQNGKNAGGVTLDNAREAFAKMKAAGFEVTASGVMA